jgi:hypothetical protein
MAEVELTVVITEDLQQKAEAAAAMRGETLSELVQMALVEYIGKTRQLELDPKKALKSDPILSMRFRSGHSDVGRRAKEILKEAVDPKTGFSVDNDRPR